MAKSPRERRREERIVRRDQLSLLARMMTEPAGRDYFYNLLSSLHVYATSFSTNQLVMAFSEGERNAGLTFQIDLMQANPEAFLQMLKEHGNVRSTIDEPDTDGDAGWAYPDDGTDH